jgi:hypothetical protein
MFVYWRYNDASNLIFNEAEEVDKVAEDLPQHDYMIHAPESTHLTNVASVVPCIPSINAGM